MSKISIIMPLFNAEKYLPEALQSILDQTHKDFELICIDDCSADSTKTIIEEFRRKDARFKLLHNEERSGAALSRNKGLKAAEGKYILFLDGDDVFEEELLEKAGSAMEEHQADLVLFEYLHVQSNTIYTKRVIERPEKFRERYCKYPFSMKDFAPREFPWWVSSPCNRMFRRSFLEANQLEFQNLASSNDVYFAQMSLFCAQRIICLDDRRVMVYARDHSEPERISNRRDPIYSFYAMERLCSELKERNMLPQYAAYLYFKLPEFFRYVLSVEKNEEYKKGFYDFLHEEGILACIKYGKEYYEQIDAYDKYLLESFQNNSYESRWFEHPDTYFQCQLKKNGDVICEFIKTRISEHKKMILWGVGINGKILLDYLSERSVRIFGITDCDKTKQGTSVDGYEIADPDVYVQEADYILVTSKEVYQAVNDIVRKVREEAQAEIVVINLLDILSGRKTHS